jgi:hypothetical protein
MGSVLRRRQVVFGLGMVVAVSLAAVLLAPRHDTEHRTLPVRLSDAEFWNLITESSEPGGYFRSENFVSNESAFQRVIPTLKKQVKADGVYLGVGPEQNFTYVSSLAPRLAFIVDIRRQNMLLHLMYKAIFELSSNRAEFLSRLFARPLPKALRNSFTIDELFEALGHKPSDPGLTKENLADILMQLREHHHFDLSQDDSRTIEFVYTSFVSAGPEIRYSFPNQYAWRRFPSYSELMLETDGTAENGGDRHSYMASEENFQMVKKMEAENRIIPIVGDFAGEKALRSVGRYMREHGAAISTFYTSNVEFYLFQTDDWRKFFTTVAALPINNDSVFIRSYFNNYGLQFQNPPGWLSPPPQSYTLLDNIPGLVAAFGGGHIHNYFDVVRRSTP